MTTTDFLILLLGFALGMGWLIGVHLVTRLSLARRGVDPDKPAPYWLSNAEERAERAEAQVRAALAECDLWDESVCNMPARVRAAIERAGAATETAE